MTPGKLARLVAGSTPLLCTVLACGHSAPFAPESVTSTTPFSATLPTRLTYNPADNYWPSWTDDGKGIIYAFSQATPDVHADDRCLGLLPPTGGTRIWELCDLRREHADSADSFAGAAIGADGRLIYMEVSAKRGAGGLSGVNPPPQTRTLWLADTAFPFQRRKLADVGGLFSGVFVNWIRDTRWIGPTSFVTLAQFQGLRHPMGSSAELDSTFAGMGVLRGEITPTGATLSMIDGTAGAEEYSLAENGAALIVARATGIIGVPPTKLERVPILGGTPTVVATISAGISDVSCNGSTCLVSSGAHLLRVFLVTGASVQLTAQTDGSARLSPTSGDVVSINFTGSVNLFPPAPPRPLGSLFVFPGLLP